MIADQRLMHKVSILALKSKLGETRISVSCFDLFYDSIDTVIKTRKEGV